MFNSFKSVEQKFKIIAIILTIAGAIPFLLGVVFLESILKNNLYSYSLIVYSGLIVSFICGSNWVVILSSSKLILSKNLIFYFLFILNSIVPILFSSIVIISHVYIGYKLSLLYMGLILISLLFLDSILFLKNFIELWWLRLRFLGSIVAGLCLIIINIVGLEVID